MSTITPSNIPIFPEEKRLVGRKNWATFKREVFLQVGSKAMDGYLIGDIKRPTSSPPRTPSPPIVTVTRPDGTQTTESQTTQQTPRSDDATKTATTTTTTTTATPFFSTTPSLEEWTARDRYVASIIISNTVDPIGIGIDETRPAFRIWYYLCKEFDQKSEQLISIHEKKLRTQKMEDETDFEGHVKTMRNLVKVARDVGASISDPQFRSIFLDSFPPSWDDFTVNVPGSSSDAAINHLEAIWVKRENRRIERQAEQAKVKALAASSQPSQNQQLSVICPNCKRRGHTKERCWSRGGGKEGHAPQGWRFPKGMEPQHTAPTNAASSSTPSANHVSSPADTYALSAASGTSACPAPIVPPPDVYDIRHDFIHPSLLREDDEGCQDEEQDGDSEIDVLDSCLVPKTQCQTCIHRTSTSLSTSARSLMDSGASNHCWRDKAAFSSYRPIDGRGQTAQAGASGEFPIPGIGQVLLQSRDSSLTGIQLSDVRHTPTFENNLLSMSSLDSDGYYGEWGSGRITVQDPSSHKVVMTAELKERMYEVNMDGATTTATYSRSLDRPTGIMTWHRRFAHNGTRRILRMARRKLVDGLNITSKEVVGMCEDCLYGKATRRPFDEKVTHETEVLERVHVDLWGPARTQSLGKKSYMMLCTDGRSSYRVPYFLANKEKETSMEAFKEYHLMGERQTGKKLRVVRIDGGGELDNSLMERYCREHGIVIERIIPYSSSSNGMAERANRTVIEGARTMLEDAEFPKMLWAEITSTFCYVDNFIPSERFPDDVPAELWSGKRQDVSHLRPIGCDAWAKLPERQRDGKLARQAVKGKLLGYVGRRGYRIWVPESRSVLESRDVRFEEGLPHRTLPITTNMPADTDQAADLDEEAPNHETLSGHEDRLGSSNSPDQPPTSTNPIPDIGSPTPGTTLPEPPVIENIPEVPPPRRSARIPQPSRTLLDNLESDRREEEARRNQLDWATDGRRPRQPSNPERAHALIVPAPWAFATKDSEHWVPPHFSDAMKNPEIWFPPMQTEYNTLMSKDCWELVPLPPGVKVIGGKWVYAIKWNAKGEIVKRKARWVAQGFTQIFGVDYDKTYGAVVRMESVRMTIALIVTLGLETFQLDFKGAYLNSPIEHDVYMRQPDGFVAPGKEGWVCKLKKTLYGTKQGAHNWYKTLSATYVDLGYYQSRADHCVRVRKLQNEYTITNTYTDDVFGGSSTADSSEKAKREMGEKWETSEVEGSVLLGVAVEQEVDGISLGQAAYFERMLKHFGLWDRPPRSTPLPSNIALMESPNPLPDDDRRYMSDKPYRELLGSMQWGQICTRPDLSFAVNLLARFQNNPGPSHWEALVHSALYVRGTLHYKLTYRRGGVLKPVGYVDADWGGCKVTRRSTSGHVFFMAGAPVAWGSKRQASVALSTVEAEYIALARASQQAVWMASWLSKVGLPVQGPIRLYGDNEGSQSLTENSKHHGLVKHIDMRHHHIREKVARGKVEVRAIPGDENVADLFTKALGGPLHRKFVSFLGLDVTK